MVFFRALCAVSREELDQGAAPSGIAGPSAGVLQGASIAAMAARQHGHSPRLYSLQRLLDCAHANMGRIRLIRCVCVCV